MSALITGQLDLLALLEEQTPRPVPVSDSSSVLMTSMEDWARRRGFSLRSNRGTDPYTAYAHRSGPRADGVSRPDPDEPFVPHFSGFPIPPGSTQTVAEAEAYYLPRIEADPEFEGLPISGDDVARWRWFQTDHGWLCFPRFRDIWPVLYGSAPPATRASTGHPSYCKVPHSTHERNAR